MSTITNVVLAFSVLEADGPSDASVLARVNAYLEGPDIGERGFVIPEGRWHGGRYAVEQPTYVGAFNYLGLDEFIAHLQSLPWKEPYAVQLFVCRQDDDRYSLINLFPDAPPCC